MKRFQFLALFAAIASLASLSSADHHKKMTVLLLDGQNNHNWVKTTPVMVHALESCGRYTVTVSTWRDAIGALWQPGTTIELEAPSVFVPNPYLFQIQSVTLNRTVADGDTATIVLMLPGAFGGTPPDVLPWG